MLDLHYSKPASWVFMCVLCLPLFASSLCAAVLGMGASAGTGQSDKNSMLVGAACCLAVVSSFAVMVASQYNNRNPGRRR